MTTTHVLSCREIVELVTDTSKATWTRQPRTPSRLTLTHMPWLPTVRGADPRNRDHARRGQLGQPVHRGTGRLAGGIPGISAPGDRRTRPLLKPPRVRRPLSLAVWPCRTTKVPSRFGGVNWHAWPSVNPGTPSRARQDDLDVGHRLVTEVPAVPGFAWALNNTEKAADQHVYRPIG